MEISGVFGLAVTCDCTATKLIENEAKYISF